MRNPSRHVPELKAKYVPIVKRRMWKIFFYLMLALATFNAISAVISYSFERYACHTQWLESAIPYKYTFRGGCLLQIDDGWLPAGNYRVQ